ncbi:hypothetical protein EAS64_10800 [Trebonia kvetii]|uniref:Uncharacterized protein n=1 Tax=Trebonia kvetii TaxID=2480626 RepID=A0A6P2C6E9_9ACTN|nr:hypothetical protein [Trebonia kvetii]TVZ05093.1 hypothetical protein EAS64_10800 [Trebonia kvetii]
MALFSRRAAAAVVACAALAIALAGCSPAAVPPSACCASHASTSSAPGGSAPAFGAAQTVPPYYAAIWAARSPAWSRPQNVTIRDTDTAKILLTVKPPAPYETFSFVAGTGAAGRWVVGAQRWHPGLYIGNNNASQFNKLYLLTYHAASGRAALTPLPVAPIQVNQLIGNVTTPEMNAGTHLLAAVALSPDGRQLATVVTSRAGYQVRVIAVPGGTVRSWSAAAPTLPIGYKGAYIPTAYNAEFTLTWLTDQRTLAMGQYSYDYRESGIKTQVLYLNTTAAEGSLFGASRAVTPSFPPAPHFTGLSPAKPAPQWCNVPVATSDGTTILCGGGAATGANAAGFANVGIWVLSARTGQLTATWAPHSVCCATGDRPRIIWASPDGRTAIITGVTGVHAVSQLLIRDPAGALRQIPWPGFIKVPDWETLTEPDVAW